MPYRCPWCGGWRYDNRQGDSRFFPLAGLGLALGLGALAAYPWYHHHHYYHPWY
ncbi:MAG: hypothetical protein LLG02_08570 [Pelosinus sp.]|nr:hypothetical protein [Pelosinus sp.]